MALVLAAAAPVFAQQGRPARFLGREEILLYGIGLKIEPAQQTVPKNIATIVSTYLQTPNLPANLPPFAPDAVVKATLRGPSFPVPVELTTAPNTPFNIPALSVPGTHTLENIRLISGGEVLLRGTPEQVTIEVIERLLVTQVTARPLTAAEIREKGIVFDSSNFQAYNFSAAFAIQDQQIALNFPVLLPSLQGAADASVGTVNLPSVSTPGLPQLKTIIPDTLKLQTQIPNLSVIGFTMSAPDALQGGDLVVPPIPGVIVIPGDIGFLNQYFSVMLMVGNVAPAGSGLDVSDLHAEIVLPAGRDTVVGTDDDPLRMAQTTQGEAPRLQLVVQPGPDGKLGTADDIGILHPGESGNAEYLVEGRREGSHVVEMQITGTLHGLPIGPIQVNGRAAGSVLVRNPKFTLTFTHPEAVAAGEPYSLDVTVTNTSEAPANFVQLSLYPRNVSGATIVGDSSRSIESIAPGDSATVSFDLISKITGKVTAATLDSDDKVAGRFELKTAIGELNIPVSPDSLVLPKEANSLPKGLRDAALGVLGKAYAVATAPPAALPQDVRRFSRKIVIDRAVEVAEAGFRKTLGEPLQDSAAQLLMDFAGSNIGRLSSLVAPQDLSFEQDNFAGFDDLRRRSTRGDVFAAAVASVLAQPLLEQGPVAFHYGLAQKWSYRPAFISVFANASGSPLPVSVSIVDGAGHRVGGVDDAGKIRKEMPYSDFLPFADASGTRTSELALLAAPAPGAYIIRLTPTAATGQPFTLSVIAPAADGALHQYTFTVAPGQIPALTARSGDPYSFTFELTGAATPVQPSTSVTVVDPSPTVMGVVQQKDADVLRCDPDEPGTPVGRVLAVLFSEEVTPASVQDRLSADKITGFKVDGNRVVGVSLQPGRRIAFIALRDPIGPHVPRQLTVDSAVDLHNQAMAPFTGPIQITVGPQAGVVSGRVIRADGTPVPYANVRLFYRLDCGDEPHWVGISSKSADADGKYSFDYVLRAFPDRIVAVDPDTSDFRSVPFNVQRDGQPLNVDIVFLGRGTFAGTTKSESGQLLRDTAIRVTSLTDNSQYGATTDASGRFSIPRVPVGNIYVEAINTGAKAKFSFSEAIPFAGAVVDREITLLDIAQQEITVKHGTVIGHVLRDESGAPAAHVPVYVWYSHLSQPGVKCPGDPTPAECAVAGGETDGVGAFRFEGVPAGSLRVSAFDQDGLLQGEVRQPLAADATIDVNVILVGGLATVTGRVVMPDGSGVVGATVGGGLSLVTTGDNGQFTLKDVPVGRREIVAVSQALGMSGRTTIDVTRAGETVNATIVFDAVGSVSGKVVKADGSTPVVGETVYVFHNVAGGIEVVGKAVTNEQGAYRVDGVRLGDYKVSSFNTGFSDGNIVPAVIKFQGQIFRADIKWRGGNGRVFGTVTTDNGNTPLRARVSLSGDRVQIAGGLVAVAFQRVNHYAITDTDFTTGAYSLSGALVGPVTVSAVGQFSPDPIAIDATVPEANASVEVNLHLQPTSEIHGVVLQPDNVHPAPAGVIVKYKSEAFKVICSTSPATGEDSCTSIPQGIQEATTVTDELGQFSFPIVNAGAFSLSVEQVETGKVGQIKGSVRAGEHAEVSVRLLGLGELSVTVFSSDTVTKIPGALVVVKQLNHPQKTAQGRAGNDGTIVFGGGDAFSEGDFTIEATDTRTGFTGRGSARITKDNDQVAVKVYLFDSVGSVYGTIYASDGLTPVPNAEVVLSNAAGPLAFTLTDATGGYRVDYVPLGSFRVEAFEAKTARRAAAGGAVDLAGQQVPVNLVQAAIGVVKGLVLDADALSPLKGWSVTLSQSSASGIALGTLQTTSAFDGSYLFPGTSRGTFSLRASLAGITGSASASGTIEQEGQVVDVPLLVKIVRPLSGTISGTVYHADGTIAPNSPVAICHPARPCENPVPLTADGEGNFSLPGVPLGRFIVKAGSQTTQEAGTAQGELQFDGDIATVRVVLGGVSSLSGTVERSGGAPAAGVKVTLTGSPDPGCAGNSCTIFTDDQGRFEFVNVPAQTFTIVAVDPLNTLLKGAVGGALNKAETRTGIRIVLAPAFALTGRVLLPGNVPLQNALAELVIDQEHHQFAQTGADGVFTLGAVPPGAYQLLLSDPLGSGVATRNVSVTADLSIGDVVLDTDTPGVAVIDPAPASTGVAQNKAITITFSEPIRPGTINATNVLLTGPAGAVPATLDVSSGDTVVTVKPLAPLADQTRYSVRVRDVQDRFGKPMAADFVASFLTVDITPPSIVEASPAAATGGAPTESVVRIKFSESIDPAKFTGAPIQLTGPAGSVAGAITYLFGNTVIVFTPNLPLTEDTVYSVTVQRATDLSGRAQAANTVYQFTTTDRTAPQIAALVPANAGNVVEGGVTSVIADVGTTHDVAVVDWYVNDVLAAASRTAPFTLSLRANTAQYGPAGSKIRIAAIATDTSGNRGTAATTELTITPDQLPAITILAPADGLSAHNGDHIVVKVRATDDLGIQQIGYRADTGNAGDALTVPVNPAGSDVTKDFSFNIPASAVPGSTVQVFASAADTKAQIAQASIGIKILDSVAPVVTITGATSGARVFPGQQTTVVVTAQDAGQIASVKFTASGLVTATETRTVNPAQASIVTTFTVTVPTTAQTGQTLTLGATATDVAGNTGTAAEVVLPVADTTPPTVSIVPEHNSFDAVPGQTKTVTVHAEDQVGVSRIDLTTSGAVNFTDAAQVSPPLGSADRSFAIPIPAQAVPGTQIQVSATATDVTSNTSGPAALVLTVVSPVQVTLPASTIVRAGKTVDVAVSMSEPAPAGGTRLDFTSDDAAIATAPTFVVIPAGETATTITIAGLSGGSTQIRALLGGVRRAAMTVTVNGGIVSGYVRDSQQNAVSGAQVTVSGGGAPQSAFTDGSGYFEVTGVAGPEVDIRALDPVTRLYGHASATMAHVNGYTSANVILIPAAAIHGTVFDADGVHVGEGVEVDIFADNGNAALGTAFTAEDGSYSFPLVTLGQYRLEASALDGHRARTTVLLDITGRDAEVNLTYLGTGTVTGAVRIGTQAVHNPDLVFSSYSIFGAAEPVVTPGSFEGTFTFTNVPLGTFSVLATDPATGQKGVATGTLTQHGQTATVAVQLTAYGAIEGHVYRSGGTQTVAGAVVTLDSARTTTSDESGYYRFDIVPLGSHSVRATDDGTRGFGSALVQVATQGVTVPANITMLPQGKVLVTVTDAGGTPVVNAFVSIAASLSGHDDYVSGRTVQGGTVLLEHVTAGSLTISASYGAQHGSIKTSLAEGELKEITVALSPTGSIAGTVYEPVGRVPAVGARVSVRNTSYSAVTDENGEFRIDGLPLGSYDVTIRDSANRLRALTFENVADDDLVVDSNGGVASREFTFVFLGTVTGRVINPDQSSAQNMPVTIWYGDRGFEGSTGMRTNGGGIYTFQNVPSGPVRIVASDLEAQLYGERTGTLDRSTDPLTLDVPLTSNAITLPEYLHDANNALYDVQRPGSIGSGQQGLFGGNFGTERGAMLLDITANGTTTRFAGTEVPTEEDSGREIATRQENVAGLSVTRKVFIPSGGYFARYLEIFRNPTDQPITIDADVTSYPTGTNTHVDRTSSGDAQFSVTGNTADRWVVSSRDTDALAAAFVLDGDAAALHATTGSFDPRSAQSLQWGLMRYGWHGITIQPGETMALLHFVSQQASPASARASAERLVQLPPEALSGIAADEAAAVKNFVLPAGGVGTIAPLPSLTGSVTGHVYEYDNQTVVPSATVTFVSSLPYFSRSIAVAANAQGVFTFTGSLADDGQAIAIPEAPFTLTAQHPQTALKSAAASGGFDAPGLTAVKDLSFTNAAVITGTVQRHNHATLAQGGTVSLTGAGIPNGTSADIQSDSTFRLAGVPAGDYTITAQVPHPQGSPLRISQPLHVVAGQPISLELVLPPTGTVKGTVTTAGAHAAPNVSVQLTQGDGFTRSTTTDSGGGYQLTDIPAGAVTVAAIEPLTQVRSTATDSVAQDLPTTVNLTLVAIASVRVEVKLADQNFAIGASVRLTFDSPLGTVTRSGSTGGDGAVTLNSVPAGPFTVTATHPNNPNLIITATGTVTSEDTVPVTLTLPPAGSVRVTVTRGTDVKVQGSQVRLSQPGVIDRTLTTDGNGVVTFTGVGGSTFTVRASHPQNTNLAVAANGTITFEGQQLPLALVLPPIGSVSGTVTMPDQSTPQGITVSLRSSSGAVNTLTGTTDDKGFYSIADVPAGTFTVTVEDFTRGVYGVAAGAIATDLENVTANIALTTNVVQLPKTLVDANGFRWDIQGDGDIGDGSSDAYDNAYRLRLFAAGTNQLFPYGSSGVSEDAGREIGINRPNLLGLDVTRKVFVPSDGYFARFLELLRNPGTTPVTVDVQVEGELGSDSYTRVIASSSGDTTVDATDRWFVSDDTTDNGDDPALAHVFAGEGARQAPAAVTQSYDAIAYRWNSVTIQPGETVALMHFAVQQQTEARAQTSAERLAQLPAEALEGLSAEEIGEVVNFNVPADGVGSLPALHRPSTGSLSVHVLGGDGIAPVSSGLVVVDSVASGIFAASTGGFVDADGRVTINDVLLAPFSIRALDVPSVVQSPIVTGSFADGETTAAAEVRFTNAGTIRGTLVRSDGSAAPTAQGVVAGPVSGTLVNGAFTLPVVPPGARTVQLNVQTLDQYLSDSGIVVTAPVTVSAAQASTVQLVLPPLGSITGSVHLGTGEPVVDLTVTMDPYGYPRTVKTDGDGNFTFVNVPVGAHNVQATSPITGLATSTSTTVADGQPATANITFPRVGDVTVKLSYPDSSAASNKYVELNGALYKSGSTDANGEITFTNLPTDQVFTVRAWETGFSSAVMRQASVQLNANADPLTVPIAMPAVATVRVYVKDEAENVIANASVSYTPWYTYSSYYAGSTNPSGYVDIRMPEGGFTVTSSVSNPEVRFAGVIAPGDHGKVLEVTLHRRITATISGTVYAGDGATKLPNTYVEIYDGDQFLGNTSTNDQGQYTTGSISVPASGFTLRAWDPGGAVHVDTQVSVPSSGSLLTINPVVPVAVITGHVSNDDDSPVQYPNVFAVRSSGPNQETYYAADSRDTGAYAVYVPAGDFTVMAVTDSGLRASQQVTIPDVMTTLEVNLKMPPTGSITGTFIGADDRPVQWENVFLSAPGVNGLVWGWTDDKGVFTFDVVPVGPFSIQGCTWVYGEVCAETSGAIASAGQNVSVTLRLARSGTLHVQVLDKAGVVPSWFEVRVEGVTSQSDTDWQYYEDGQAAEIQAPEGTVRVAAQGADGYAVTEATIVPGRTTSVELHLGTATPFTVKLAGPDGFAYDVRCEGRLLDGGSAQYPDAYDSAFWFNANGGQFPCVSVATTQQDGRELVLGPARLLHADGEGSELPIAGLQVTRRIFSPAQGGYVRYFDLVTNTSTQAQTVTAKIRGVYGPSAPNVVLATAPAATGNTYGVLSDATGTSPVIANVFAGPGAAAPATAHMAAGSADFDYSWTFTLAPGQSRAVLTFGVQRGAADVAGAQAQAESLAALTDADALLGLTSEDRAMVVNFAVPGANTSPALHGTIAGVVVAADGITALRDAAVFATDVATGRVIQAVRSDVNGGFAFTDMYAGAGGIRVVASYGQTHNAEALVVFSTPGDAVTNLKLTLPVSVLSGTISRDGAPVANPVVLVRSAAGQDISGRAGTDASGHYGVVDLPAGDYIVTALDGGQTTAVSGSVSLVAANPVATLDLDLPDAAACVEPLSSLAGWWAGESSAADKVRFGDDGTANAGVSYVAGKVGQAFSIDGASGNVTIESTARLERAFSIEAWVMPRATGTADTPRWFVSRAGVNGDVDLGLAQAASYDDGTQRFRFYAGGDGINAWTESTTVVQSNRFYHLVGTFDGTDMRFYVDGVLESTVTRDGSRAITDTPVVLGASAAGSGASCDCAIDEVKLYERALTTAEVQGALASASAGSCSDFTIVTDGVPASFEGQPYSARIRAVGGAAPPTFTISDGAMAPGLTLSNAGEISGTPTAAGSYSFTVTAADAASVTRTATFTQACGTCQSSPAGLVSYWNANGSARDPIGGKDGYLLSTAFGAGVNGQAFSFASGSMVYPHSPQIELHNTFTLEFWVNPTVERASTAETTSGMAGTADQHYAVGPNYRYSNAQANMGVSVGTNGISVFEHGPNYMPSVLVYDAPISGWTHVAVVYQNNRASLYVNGVHVRDGLVSPRDVYVSHTFGNNLFAYGAFTGQLDEIGIYNRALTPTEIAAIAITPVLARCPLR